MGLLGLREHLWGVIFGEEQMIHGGRDFNSKPLAELLVLQAHVLDALFDLDLLEQFSQPISFNNISAKTILVSTQFQ